MHSTSELAKILDRKERFCSDWVERGLIVADIPAAGSGTRREFSYAGVLRAYLALYFQTKYGFKRKNLKKLMDDLASHWFFHYWAFGTKLIRRGFFDLSPEKIEEYKARGVNGCLIIINPYDEERGKSLVSPLPIPETLKDPNIIKEFEGIQDMIAINLADIKKEIDQRISQL